MTIVERLVERVARFAYEADLLHSGDTVVVACSGGPDSLALLDILQQLSPRLALRLVVAHYEHGIRGAASQADADFVADFAARQQPPLTCVVGHGDVPAAAASQGVSLEAAAREMRYDFLETVRQRYAAAAVAVAHHEDDQAETVLMRILRGTGVDGLAAMRPRGVSLAGSTVIRPLLDCTRAEIEDYCAARQLAPRHDATNDIADCTRNRLRLELLPRLRREYNPAVTQALARLARVAADESDYIESQAAVVYEACRVRRAGRPWLDQHRLAAQPVAIERVVLRRFCRECLGSRRDVDFAAIERLRHLVRQGHTGSREQLLRGCVAELSYGWLGLRHEGLADMPAPPDDASAAAADVPAAAGEWDVAGWHFRQLVAAARPDTTGPLELYYSPAEMPGALELRTRRPGDYIELPAGTVKLKKLFIDSKLPREARASYPLLACGSEVIWVPGLRRSRRCQGRGDRLLVLQARRPDQDE